MLVWWIVYVVDLSSKLVYENISQFVSYGVKRKKRFPSKDNLLYLRLSDEKQSHHTN